ncbi:tRNA epoxyqueuosine(34) reductase QueG [Tundrisphaera lichenicola]|uniref:tRNA epoxyqueuosine(34) reductase QueG n=1 Tax=Tundrisphaera lichenicola TaxID=2029860 RepID=UPI003EB7FF82
MSDQGSGLTDRLKDEARRLGFELVGVAPAVVPTGYGRYLEWLEQGREAGMAYLKRQAEARAHPRFILEGARSVIVVGMIYGTPGLNGSELPRGKVARYARGADYHEILWRKLDSLLDWLRLECPGVVGRGVCDSAPLLERDFARMAGLGWIGKNTCLIDRRAGSFTVLGSLLVDIELEYDVPHETNHCGTCRRCLDSCPTDAFVGPYQLDARRCISYWTIEHRGPIPEAVADRLDGWVFGCDICQDVCPWNRKAPPGREPALDPRPEWANPDLIDWLGADPAEFSRAIKGTALSRSKRSGLLRNAALLLGAGRVFEALPVLIGRLEDQDPVIRGASAWALGRIGSPEAVDALERARDDADPAARDAVRRALAAVRPRTQDGTL